MPAGGASAPVPGRMAMLTVALIAIVLVIAQAAVGALPAVIAQREGGAGLGSALVVGQSAQLAAAVLGAVIAAVVVARRPLTVLAAGALLIAVGLPTVELLPHHELAWTVAPHVVVGCGLGVLLTAAYTAAAGLGHVQRPAGIALLLVAAMIPRGLVGLGLSGGTLLLALAGAAAAAVALVVAAVGRRAGFALPSPASDQRGPISALAVASGGIVLGLGVLSAAFGADPSRVAVALIALQLGINSLETIQAIHSGLFVVGLALLLVGSLVVMRATNVDRRSLAATPALALIALGGAAVAGLVTFLAATSGGVPGVRDLTAGGAGAVVGALTGIGLGWWWLARAGRPRMVAIVGALVLMIAAVAAVVGRLGAASAIGGAQGQALVMGLGGLGVGLGSSALRLVLADVPPRARGLAAAAGVVAVLVGSALGSQLGTAEGLALLTAGAVGAGPSLGLAVILGAPIAALALARVVPSSRAGDVA